VFLVLPKASMIRSDGTPELNPPENGVVPVKIFLLKKFKKKI
jgi:hypothetical protein